MILPEFFDYLTANEDEELNGGAGFWLDRNAPPEKLHKLRELHEEDIKRGKPYWILDFLMEDFQSGVELERRGIHFYRKTDGPR